MDRMKNEKQSIIFTNKMSLTNRINKKGGYLCKDYINPFWIWQEWKK